MVGFESSESPCESIEWRQIAVILHSSQLPKPEIGYDLNWDQSFDQKSMVEENQYEWPKLSIVTPSFNQGRFIERTIRCILLQGYPNLEFIVIDGGSTDETLKIIEKYAPWISYWVSEPDSGMYDAINKGFAKSTGEFMGWSPTSDLYESGALRLVGRIFSEYKKVAWVTSNCKVICNEKLEETGRYIVEGFSRKAFMKGLNFLGGSRYARFMIQQQSTFWRRSLWEKCGGRMDDTMRGAGDFELWARFFASGERLFCTDAPIGIYMEHQGQESVANAEGLLEEQHRAFERYGGRCMIPLENLMRQKILKRRPFLWLKNYMPSSFCSDIVEIDQGGNPVCLGERYFV